MKGIASSHRHPAKLSQSEKPVKSASHQSFDNFIHRHKATILFVVFVFVLWLFLSYLFCRRFPDNYQQPNFYAEDGNVFARNIIMHGFWRSIMMTFNGYYIWGIYALEGIGFGLNNWLFGGQFANLPRSLSLVSYGFLGLMAILPVALFRRFIGFVPLLLLALLIVYVPLRGSDYAVIGTIGNMKFAFIYIAFVLLCYRHILPDDSKKIYLVDAGLLLGAYTNITVYVMLPFALLRYWPKVDYRHILLALRTLLVRNRGFQSLIALGLALLPQLYVVQRDGVPMTPGYLTNPFNFHRAIEIFVSRSYLYDILFPINRHLNDVIVVVLFVIFVGIAWQIAKRYRFLLALGIFTIFAGTFLFVVKRTGISDFFIGYRDGGQDQFFYPQNWIFSFMLVLVLADLIRRVKKAVFRFGAYVLLFAIAIFFIAPMASNYGLNTFMAKTVGNIYSVGQHDCATKAQSFNLSIYPTKEWAYPMIGRQALCTAVVVNYQPQDVSLGLAPYHNNYLPITDISFTQTFVATANNLNGLDIYFSTFMSKVNSPYDLQLYSANCKQQLFDVKINTGILIDDAFSPVLFPAIADSGGKTYCFSLHATHLPAQPLAIQLSAPDEYLAGRTVINGKPSDQDVVFGLHYRY